MACVCRLNKKHGGGAVSFQAGVGPHSRVCNRCRELPRCRDAVCEGSGFSVDSLILGKHFIHELLNIRRWCLNAACFHGNNSGIVLSLSFVAAALYYVIEYHQ